MPASSSTGPSRHAVEVGGQRQPRRSPARTRTADTGIYAQDLSADGRELLGQPVKIFAPVQPWEGTIVEAPDMIEAWGTYWLFFSGNWYYSTSYGIGVAACQSPFGPCSDPEPRALHRLQQPGRGPGRGVRLPGRDTTSTCSTTPSGPTTPDRYIARPVAMTRLGFTPRGPVPGRTVNGHGPCPGFGRVVP